MKFKKLYQADSNFKTKTKGLFLHAFNQQFPNYPKTSLAFRYFVRGVGVGASFVVLLSVTAIYADQTNVGAESLLYPFKRTQEIVNLKFSAEIEKPEAHLKLAERRVNEIKDISEKNPDSPIIKNLQIDLEREINNSIETIPPVIVSKEISNRSADAEKSDKVQEVGKTVSIPALAPTAQAPAQLKENNKNSEPSKIQAGETSLSGKASNKNRSFCDSWRRILEDDDKKISDVVGKNEEILRRFSASCGTLDRVEDRKEKEQGESTESTEKEFEREVESD